MYSETCSTRVCAREGGRYLRRVLLGASTVNHYSLRHTAAVHFLTQLEYSSCPYPLRASLQLSRHRKQVLFRILQASFQFNNCLALSQQTTFKLTSHSKAQENNDIIALTRTDKETSVMTNKEMGKSIIESEQSFMTRPLYEVEDVR